MPQERPAEDEGRHREPEGDSRGVCNSSKPSFIRLFRVQGARSVRLWACARLSNSSLRSTGWQKTVMARPWPAVAHAILDACWRIFRKLTVAVVLDL